MKSYAMIAGGRCQSCDTRAEPSDVYFVEARPGAPPIERIFPDSYVGARTVARLCTACAAIANTPLGESFGAVAEPEFRIVGPVTRQDVARALLLCEQPGGAA